MFSNRLQGAWDQVKGFNRELWGELTGNERAFSAGKRQLLIGRLEAGYGMNRDEAEQKVDQLAQ